MRHKKGIGMKAKATLIAAAVLAAWLASAQAQSMDPGTAEALMRKSGCFKCHSISAKKDGPSYKSVAEKYRGKPDAEAKLHAHLTTNPTIKVDGKEERHESLKTKDEAEIKNVILFVLSR
jgi:cytochrome c